MVWSRAGYAILNSYDHSVLAEHIGWTDISTHDAIVLVGRPPDDEIEWYGWRRKKRALQGEMPVPCYSAYLDEMKIVEAKIFKRGLWKKYVKHLKAMVKRAKEGTSSASEAGMGEIGACANLRCAAALLTFGEKFEE